MPPNIRAFLISSKAAEKLVNLRVTPSMAFEDTLRDVSSPKVCDRICVAAPLTQECAEGYSGKAGVVISGVHAESAMVLSLPSVSPSWPSTGDGKHYAIHYAKAQDTQIGSCGDQMN